MNKLAFFPSEFGNDATLITLPHPRNGQSNDFILKDGKLFEIQLVDREYCSFFMDNYAVADGSALFAYQVHPVFLVLPYMFKQKSEYTPKKDFFFNSPFKQIEDLVFPYFGQICTELPFDDTFAYALDQKKMLKWLVGRCEKIMPILRKKNSLPDNQLIEIAWGVVRHYLPQDITQLLKEELQKAYEGSFPVKKLEDVLTPNLPQSEAVDDVKKKTPPKSKKADLKSRPKGVADIASFFKK
ncbi:hypothetical protein TVAG_361430 [Trichomonas vaginalis G3]|uniref:Rnh202 triple barrel domain-containing protein n=1 Tax=Trichomonas vaginalis (strain ATCC PRA-98 / G3) TaxID=412133 RepID=A2FZR0_TRIV3|nr:ribonuclease H2 subunit B family [Trichomonas vaginalis G3]EAX89600.1 hypothetical protein TVAG_361430 [Trichomonas vaginalis G3]KAI5512102.1 ribonuclease H2 subunit B family [Trichomonas vaginalis G3]|eukprot:XP_001302530.1 hypothetical protein [Trichomonas vaginalis G3]